jgi:hypothetical protein
MRDEQTTRETEMTRNQIAETLNILNNITSEYCKFLENNLRIPSQHRFFHYREYESHVSRAMSRGETFVNVSEFETTSGKREVFEFGHLV